MRIFCLIFLIVFLFTQCKKKEENTGTSQSYSTTGPPPCPTSPIPISDTNMLKCKFKPGTYWVFQDSLTNNIDTLVVKTLGPYSGNVPYGIPSYWCPVEKVLMEAVFKNDTGNVLIKMNYVIMNDGFFLNSDFFWTSGGQPVPYAFKSTNVNPSYKTWDSLYIYNQYYKNVGVSYDIQFTSVEYQFNPTTMYCQSLKSYFNTEFGFLQFDLRNRLTWQLTGRRKIIARNIVK